MSKKYAVKTRLSFTGSFFVDADTPAEARKWVDECCGLVLGGSIHTCLSEEDVDWDFPGHPDKHIISIRRNKK
jgi:hypothetical protein